MNYRELGLLHEDCITVTGKTVGENIKDCVNRESIRLSDLLIIHIVKQVVLQYLKGNLAPDGSVVKRSAVVDEMMVHKGPARVFECEEDAIAAIKGRKDCCMVMLLLSDMKDLRVALE